MSQDHSTPEILRGIEAVSPENALPGLLETSVPLLIKAGFDPTAPDLHLGHTVLINKLRQFQLQGHVVHFVVGDFTASIGDPSGQKTCRPSLVPGEIRENALTYQEQACKILDPEKTRFSFNSSWLGKLGAKEVVQLARHSTVARMLERNDFSKRYASETPIALHEFLYPLFQAYDSVVLKANVEVGGSDQLFNMLLGRSLQREWNLRPQVVMTLPLLVGLDGEKKMSKSFGNSIPLESTPREMFGKLMSIPDTLMWSYLELLSFREESSIGAIKKQVSDGLNPMVIKYDLAEEITARFHSASMALAARHEFNARFAEGKLPKDVECREVTIPDSKIPLVFLLKMTGLTRSTSEAVRALQQGGVRIDGERVSDQHLCIKAGSSNLFQVGKRRFLRLRIKTEEASPHSGDT